MNFWSKMLYLLLSKLQLVICTLQVSLDCLSLGQSTGKQFILTWILCILQQACITASESCKQMQMHVNNTCTSLTFCSDNRSCWSLLCMLFFNPSIYWKQECHAICQKCIFESSEELLSTLRVYSCMLLKIHDLLIKESRSKKGAQASSTLPTPGSATPRGQWHMDL